MDGRAAETLGQIAKTYNFSRERVRQIVVKALATLRLRLNSKLRGVELGLHRAKGEQEEQAERNGCAGGLIRAQPEDHYDSPPRTAEQVAA